MSSGPSLSAMVFEKPVDLGRRWVVGEVRVHLAVMLGEAAEAQQAMRDQRHYVLPFLRETVHVRLVVEAERLELNIYKDRIRRPTAAGVVLTVLELAEPEMVVEEAEVVVRRWVEERSKQEAVVVEGEHLLEQGEYELAKLLAAVEQDRMAFAKMAVA